MMILINKIWLDQSSKYRIIGRIIDLKGNMLIVVINSDGEA